LFFDYLSSDGWKFDSDNKVMRFTYRNAFAVLSLEYQETSKNILYLFKEGEIESLVKIEPKDKLLKLLQMISILKKELFSSQYAKHLNNIIDVFPNTYYYKDDRFVLLANKDIV